MLGDLRGHRRLFGLLLLAVSALALVVPLPARGEGESVTTTLRYTDPSTNGRVLVAGATITVSTPAGESIAEAVSGEDGKVEIPVPGPGAYVVAIDPSTLPGGVTLVDPARAQVTVQVEANQSAFAIFALTAGAPTEKPNQVKRVLQLALEGLKLGIFIAMGAIGLSLIFGTTGLVNFAHGEMITWGMLVAYFFNLYGLAGLFGFMKNWPWIFGHGVDLITATVVAVALGCALGWAMDAWIFSPLRNGGVSLIAQLVVSIGLSIFLRYFSLYLFGGSSRFFRSFAGQKGMHLGPVEVTPKDLISMIISVVVLLLVGVVLQRTRIGRAMRAVSDNRDLAATSGIDVQRVIRLVWMAGGGLAALGGVFFAQANQIIWDSGFRILLLIFSGVILGGLGTAFGALVGSVLVGLGIQLSTLIIPIELKDIGALALLVVVLLVRPQGVLGRRERIG